MKKIHLGSPFPDGHSESSKRWKTKLPHHADKAMWRRFWEHSLLPCVSQGVQPTSPEATASNVSPSWELPPLDSYSSSSAAWEEHGKISGTIRCLLTQTLGPAVNGNIFQLRCSEKELNYWHYWRGGDKTPRMLADDLSLGRLGEVGMFQEKQIKLPENQRLTLSRSHKGEKLSQV